MMPRAVAAFLAYLSALYVALVLLIPTYRSLVAGALVLIAALPVRVLTPHYLQFLRDGRYIPKAARRRYAVMITESLAVILAAFRIAANLPPDVSYLLLAGAVLSRMGRGLHGTWFLVVRSHDDPAS